MTNVAPVIAEWYDKIEVHRKLSEQKNSKLVAIYEADNQEGRDKDYYNSQLDYL